MITIDANDRARKFLASAKTARDATKTRLAKDMDILKQAADAYAEVTDDFIEARIQYIELIEKYETAGEGHLPLAGFPGIVSKISTYSPEEMQGDTADMLRLSGIVQELEKQLDTVESQVKNAAQHVYRDVDDIAKATTAVITYTTDLIQTVNSPYAAGSMAK